MHSLSRRRWSSEKSGRSVAAGPKPTLLTDSAKVRTEPIVNALVAGGLAVAAWDTCRDRPWLPWPRQPYQSD